MAEGRPVPDAPGGRIFDAVVIPRSRRSGNAIPSVSGSTATVSSASSVDNGRSDYDTPATSIAVTPEASVKGKSTTTRLKRSRLSDETTFDGAMDIDADQSLAERLQREEYEQEERPNKRSKQTHQREQVSDSELTDVDDDDESVLSSVPSEKTEESFDFTPTAMAKSRKPGLAALQHKSVLQSGRTPHQPLRKATLGARKSMADTSIAETLDSAMSDDSALSEPASDDDFEGEGHSEAEESDALSEDGEPLALRHPVGGGLSAEDSLDDPSVTTRPLVRYKRGRRGRRGTRPPYLDAEINLDSFRCDRKTRERRKLEKSHPSIKTMWKTLEEIPVIKPEQAAQPEAINRKLKSFQLEGLDWMIKQEKTQYRGGLLGDEMGMGKTIQAVSLIMSDYPAKEPTLVVVPPVALMQWSNEIKEYTDGKLNVLVFHGQNAKTKGMKVKDLKKFDVIMVSYNGLESLHRKETKGWSRGEDLVKEASPIHAIHFHRLILDEAHSIKSRTTGVAKACFALRSDFKWCLSGTPVQNRIGEFFSLLRFLEVRPFADYFCKKCSCAMLHWSVDKNHRCSHCKHGSMEHVSVFNQELLNPLTQSEDPKDRTKAMEKLHMITARIMLRRMKRDHVSSMELPPKEVIIHKEFFGEIERDFSSSIMTNTARQFDTYVSRGVMLNNYANIFGLIMQMRQVSNHPDLLLKKHAHEGQNVLVCNICDEPAEEAIRSRCKHDFCRACVKSFVRSMEDDGGEADCPRCHIPLEIDFDQPEIEQDEEAVKKSSIINRIRMEDWTSSTKIEMLVYDLWKLRSKKQTMKSIIFSQFTSMLQLVEWRLRRAGFNTVMLDGSMTPIQRQRSIDHFMNNPDVEIFLVSLKAGGVALNLTEASRVFIIDPWWNPAAEWQSADRCHRIGQKRPCVITRLCIEDSVESRIVMLQEKKANMISSTINNDKVAMEKLTPEDMQFLFRGT